MTAPDPVQEEFNEDEGQETEVIVEPVVYPDMQEVDEQRRAFVFKYMADAEIDGRIFVQNLEMVAAWLKDGSVPAEPKKPRVKVVESEKS